MTPKSKKILFVTFSDSIHAVRWINQISAHPDYELYLFSSGLGFKLHPELRNVRIYTPYNWLKKILGEKVHQKMYYVLRYVIERRVKNLRSRRLKAYINKVKPQLIHSLETQQGGYLVLDTKKRYFANKHFPPWWHTNFGSDFYLFGRIKEHKIKIQNLLEECDYYSCESERDKMIALQLGYKKVTLSTYPNAGGFNIGTLERLKQGAKPPSARRFIMLKGYQGWAGRALVAMKALALVHKLLEGYTIVLYSNDSGEDVQLYRQLLENDFGLKFIVLPGRSSHLTMLEHFSQARIYIGLSISDGISTSVLEAMACGCFPIQSNTSTADEWVTDGISAFIVEPEDPFMVADAIRKSLTNDALVDSAAAINWQTVIEKLDETELKKLTINSYNQILFKNQ